MFVASRFKLVLEGDDRALRLPTFLVQFAGLLDPMDLGRSRCTPRASRTGSLDLSAPAFLQAVCRTYIDRGESRPLPHVL